jgi:hypothetical protein
MTICSWFGLEKPLQINIFDCSLNLCFPKLLKLFTFPAALGAIKCKQ